MEENGTFPARLARRKLPVTVANGLPRQARGNLFMMRTITAAILAASAMGLPAAATTLTGNAIGIQYIFPTSGSVFEDTGTNVVGTDGPTSVIGIFSLSFTDTTATASNFTFDTSWTPADFNGFRLYDINGTIPTFTSVTINQISNMAGLDASRIAFDADNVYVNWNGLSFDTNTVVTLNISGAVPEAQTWAMMIVGFGLVGAAMRRRAIAHAA
jgi:hypothetical protein